jgi:hypothetical protein
MGVHHHLLHRMQPAIIRRETVHRKNDTTFQLGYEENAGVDGLIADQALDETANHDRARAAITLAAALLGAREALRSQFKSVVAGAMPDTRWASPFRWNVT